MSTNNSEKIQEPTSGPASSLLLRHMSYHEATTWWKVTCWSAVQYSYVVCSRTTVVCRRAIIPDNHHLLRTFKTPHGANMSFSSVLLPPLPVRSADDSRSYPFHHRSVIPAGGHLKKEVSLRRGNLFVLEGQQLPNWRWYRVASWSQVWASRTGEKRGETIPRR